MKWWLNDFHWNGWISFLVREWEWNGTVNLRENDIHCKENNFGQQVTAKIDFRLDLNAWEDYIGKETVEIPQLRILNC